MSILKPVVDTAKENNRKLLIPYLVAGDPDLKTTLALMHQLVDEGADIIELGVPFSDPSSDGPVIQRGVERALKKGTALNDVLTLVEQFRQTNQTTAIVLMGYLNPVEIMGYKSFSMRCADVGVDGVLLVDMPPAESAELHQHLREAEIDTIYLVAPTTTQERARSIVEHCSGYLYYVSLKGVTGAALVDHESVARKIDGLRAMTDLPIMVGFGIKDGESAVAMAKQADGVIIGSALVSQIANLSDQESNSEFSIGRATAMIGDVRKALDTSF
ncbi:MAG: tryptophan synthase subunit alpha [Pseudohongiellaceae bacterium]